jgi:hypothetical protein
MRCLLILGVVWAVSMSFGLDRPASARAEPRLERAACVKLALEKKKLEKGGVEAYLAMKPQKVLSSRGRPVVAQVRHYITIREKVLFRCPRNVLNATAAPIKRRHQVKPPLPIKGPKRAVRHRPRQRLLVPLPVKRQSSFKFPTSQG